MRVSRIGSLVGIALAGVIVAGSGALAEPHWVAMDGDFDGDGHRELVVGAYDATVAGKRYAGAVGIFGGSASGPAEEHVQRLDVASDQVPGEPAYRFGSAVASGDFNADGYADLAVCSVMTSDAAAPNLTVVFGSETGLRNGIEVARDDDTSCSGLASGDFDADGYVDLIVAGREVYLAKGSPDADEPAGWRFARVSSDSELSAFSDPVAGDINGDGYLDVAYLETVGEDTNTSTAHIALGGPDGFSSHGSVTKSGESSDIALGDINADSFDDLAFGLAEQTSGDGHTEAGQVKVWNGSVDGLDLTATPLTIGQNSPGVPGVSETDDRFGLRVALGDANGDGFADLAISAPGEDGSNTTNSGGVVLIPGDTAGPLASASLPYHQGTPGIPGVAETDDLFGRDLALRDYTGDGSAELLIGATSENAEGRVWLVPDLQGSTASVFGPRAVQVEPARARFGEPLS